MILTSLSLKNIRSYSNELISFSEGITFLSGDIGSGKSSLLQAIEFALFGFKRGDLEGFHLLRKGESRGEVEIKLLQNNKEITITRKIKKTKQGIVQDNGFFNQEELSPTELTAKIFETLHFPKEFLTKDRNLLYRFSTYTPQEQLKEILYAEHEKRLEIIRKLFQVDKYKQLQSASDLYLKELRDRKLFLKGSMNNDLNLEEEEKKLTLKIKEIEEKLIIYREKLKPVQEKVISLKEKQELIKKKLHIYQDKYVDFEKKLSIITNYREQKISLEKELKEFNKESIKKQINDYQKELDISKKQKENNEHNLFKKTQEMNTIGEEIVSSKKQQERFQQTKVQLLIKEKEIEELKKLIRGNQRVIIKSRIKDLEVMLQKVQQKLTKLEKKESELTSYTKEYQSQEIKKTSLIETLKHKENHLQDTYSLNTCNVCMQDVSIAQKEHIKTSLKEEIQSGTNEINLLSESLKKLKSKMELLELEVKEKQEYILQITSLQEKKNLQVQELQKEQEKQEEYSTSLKEATNDYDTLKKKVFKDSKNSSENLEKRKQQVQKELEQATSKQKELELLIKELLHNKEKQEDKLNQFSKYQEKVEKINKSLEKEPLLVQSLEKIKTILASLKEKEEKINASNTSLFEKKQQLDLIIREQSTILHSQEQELKKIQKKLEYYNKQKKELERIEKEYSFLEQQVIPGSATIEKTLFTKFWVEFNEHFTATFKELIEDQEFDVYLRDDFSIVVEQNGYEIDISNLSGGEKSSLAVSYRLALKKIIESNLGRETMLDMLILDEPTDGFSEQQISRLGYLLKESGVEQILLVSHDEKIESIADTVLHVEKKHHESRIVA